MREATGDLWRLVMPGECLIITTNGAVRRDGRAVMGRGIAREAADRIPELPMVLGEALRFDGNHVFRLMTWTGILILSFPVKHHWSEAADPDLIVRSARELAGQSLRSTVWMPRPGCGNGRLEWPAVRQLIEPILDDRFVVVGRRGE